MILYQFTSPLKVYTRIALVTTMFLSSTGPYAQSTGQHVDCSKPIDEIASRFLSDDQKKTLGPNNAFEDTSIGETISAARTLFSFVTRGTTDLGDAKRALNASRYKAIKLKVELCSDQQPTSSSGEPAAISAASSPTLPKPKGQESSVEVSDWKGEISGTPVVGGSFNSLQIGMTATTVLRKIGLPDDERLSEAALSFVPFYTGANRLQLVCSYKGMGVLVFVSAPGLYYTDMHLVRIIHYAQEPGKLK